MEGAPGSSAVGRNGVGSFPPMSSSAASQAARKEWRVVNDESLRNSGNEELERSKISQADERLIYEVQHGREPLDVDFCSVTMGEGLDNGILQQRYYSVSKQREELQHMEIELRSQIIVRSELVGIQNEFDARVKEHANAAIKLQDQLLEKEKRIHELERTIDEKERELHAIRLDKEAAWAKEDLLREQSMELLSYKRERDNSEAERAQHIKQIHDFQEHIREKEHQFIELQEQICAIPLIKQIHDFQEHIREKEHQFIELQEQHRIVQETVIFKDEQIREAQAWITHAQEMDSLQSTANQTLQAELRERTEQYNQLWLGCQRQFGEMERLHLHIQQLQLELADAREKCGSHSDGSHVSCTNSNDASRVGHASANQLEANASNSPSLPTSSLQDGNSETSVGNTAQTDGVHGIAFTPSIFGMPPTYLPTALHPYLMHPQGLPHPSHVTQAHFHSLPTMSSFQNWPNQQALPDGDHIPMQNPYPQQAGENLLRADSNYDYEGSVNGQVRGEDYLDSKVDQETDVDHTVSSPDGKAKVRASAVASDGTLRSDLNLQQISSKFQEALALDNLDQGNAIKNDSSSSITVAKEKNSFAIIDRELDNKIVVKEHSNVANILTLSGAPNHSEKNHTETALNTVNSQKSNAVGKTVESYLLDERALLACIARTIGSGGRIRISSTLPNRLGKMLAPHHWHDYKRKYGKLDDFVASHPDLFLIEEDHIQLREGALEIIAATAAVAKVAAVKSSQLSLFPSVAVTPMAQPQRLKKVVSLESSVNVDKNGASSHVAGVSSIKILTKSKDSVQLNGVEARPLQTVLLTVGNLTNSDRSDFSQSGGASQGKPGLSSVGKHSRTMSAASPGPRR